MQTRLRSVPLTPTQAAVNSHPSGAPAEHTQRAARPAQAPTKAYAYAVRAGTVQAVPQCTSASSRDHPQKGATNRRRTLSLAFVDVLRVMFLSNLASATFNRCDDTMVTGGTSAALEGGSMVVRWRGAAVANRPERP